MNLNQVQIIGRITKTPELRATPSGMQVTKFSVATNRKWKSKTGEKKEEVEYHNVTAFGRTAEVICQYFATGDEIYIQGYLKTDHWEGTDGSKRNATNIMAERFEFGQKSPKNVDRTQKDEDVRPDPVGEDEIRLEDIPF